MQLVCNFCYALRKTLGVTFPRLVGEGPPNREEGGSPLCWARGWLLTVWSFVTRGWIDGHQRGLAWQIGGKKVPRAVGESCISMEITAPCQNPGRGLGTAQASWDGDTSGGDMGSKQQKWDLAPASRPQVLLQGLESDPSERLCFLKGCSWGVPCCLAGSRGQEFVEHWFYFCSLCEVMFGWFQFVLSLGLIWKKKTPFCL